MAKINENIKSLAEIMKLMENLEEPSFLAEQGILIEDVPTIKEELTKQISEYKQEIQQYIEYKLGERMEHKILSSGIGETIKVLSERKRAEDNKIEKIDSWIDYLCKFANIDEFKSTKGEIKYSGGEKMKVIDGSVLPDELKVFSVGEIKIEDKEKLKEMGYDASDSPKGLTEVKKWFKQKQESWEKQILETVDKLNNGQINKEEHDQILKNIGEDKKKYEGKVRIDDSKALSVKQ